MSGARVFSQASRLQKAAEKRHVAERYFDSPVVCYKRKILPQDVQKGRSVRPQASRNRRRTLRGTLRILMSRERSWRTFSASCKKVT